MGIVYEKGKVSQRNKNKVPKPPNVIWISDFIVELLSISLSFPPSLSSHFVPLRFQAPLVS